MIFIKKSSAVFLRPPIALMDPLVHREKELWFLSNKESLNPPRDIRMYTNGGHVRDLYEAQLEKKKKKDNYCRVGQKDLTVFFFFLMWILR